MAGAPLTLEWLGCATFRVRVAGLTLFFDTYVDRVPGTGSSGVSAVGVSEADFVFLSHAHFDHMLGADVIAARTGASVIGSYECARLLRANGVPDAQVLPASGGETVECGRGVRVRVFPSLHSCLFAGSTPDSGAACIGDLEVSHQLRRERVAALFNLIPALLPQVAGYFATADAHSSRDDGGPLTYLLETPEGSVLITGSTGYWTGIVERLHPDVAVLATAGRPNVDGEPYQGSLADYLVAQVELLRPAKVVLCHQDVLLPDVLPALDVGPAVAALRDRAPAAAYVEMAYGEPRPVLSR